MKTEKAMTQEKSGAQLASDVQRRGFDPDFLIGYFVTFAGKVADGEFAGREEAAARSCLQHLMTFDLPAVMQKP